MTNRPTDLAVIARALRMEHGQYVDQFVVDRIFESIRNADMEAAKWWDLVGSYLDEQNSSGPT